MIERSEFLLLALQGVLLIAVSGYTQWVSTDLNQYPLSEYLAAGLETWQWWTVVGLPFIFGWILIAAAWVARDRCRTPNSSRIFFGGCLVFSLALLSVGGVGYLGATVSALIFVYVLVKYRTAGNSA